jgi:hypothetical protein
MWVELLDGRILGVPFAWFPRLLNATLEQREAVEIGRFGLHWEDIDEDISIDELLAGKGDYTRKSLTEVHRAGTLSPSGVRIADDFRANLIIDRYDPVFADMRVAKRDQIRSENSEDAITWNVFRSLRQIAPRTWLPLAWGRAFPTVPCPTDLDAVVKLWKRVSPPPSLLASGKEGPSEIDVIIDTPTWVWFIEAKYRSDISLFTVERNDRDQVIRNIDVGSFYAGTRRFAFSLLLLSETHSPNGVGQLEIYKDLSIIRSRLVTHRPDELQNIIAISWLTWTAMAHVLTEVSTSAPNHEERLFAARAVNWLRGKL